MRLPLLDLPLLLSPHSLAGALPLQQQLEVALLQLLQPFSQGVLLPQQLLRLRRGVQRQALELLLLLRELVLLQLQLVLQVFGPPLERLRLEG